jgi:hypothetical protein
MLLAKYNSFDNLIDTVLIILTQGKLTEGEGLEQLTC